MGGTSRKAQKAVVSYQPPNSDEVEDPQKTLELEKAARKLFKHYDHNQDGELNEKEFKKFAAILYKEDLDKCFEVVSREIPCVHKTEAQAAELRKLVARIVVALFASFRPDEDQWVNHMWTQATTLSGDQPLTADFLTTFLKTENPKQLETLIRSFRGYIADNMDAHEGDMTVEVDGEKLSTYLPKYTSQEVRTGEYHHW